MGSTDSSADLASFRDSIPEAHQRTYTLLEGLIEEQVPDAEVSVKWNTLAYGSAAIGTQATLKLTIRADGTCVGSIDGTDVITKQLKGMKIQGHVALLNEAGRSTFDNITLPKLKQP